MRKRFFMPVLLAVFGAALASASGASAATEFGNNCTGNRAESSGGPYSLIQLSQGGAPVSAPTSGIVTKWKVRIVAVPFGVPQQLKIFRPTANPTQFQVVGESASEPVVTGENVFSTRIPIQAGDHLGLFGNSSVNTLFCAETAEVENPGNSIGEFTGNPGPGSTATLSKTKTEELVPAVAVIEPDADGDGFGDETQDGCPQSASFQGPCPTITLDSVAVVAGSKAVVFVTTNNQAPVKVSGTVKLGKGKTAKLKAGPKAVVPSKITSFSLKFSKQLKSALSELPASKKLALKITASATNVIGQVSTDKSTLKLKKQG